MSEDLDVKGITVKKSEDIAAWYEQVCLKSELVDFGVVKGTMVIRPRAYHIWETIRDTFDKQIVEKIGAENAYFPLFIPESFFHKEAEHAEGFSPEVAWIDSELTKGGERIAIRPTSETIMYDSFSRWIRSYKDLPLKINQWCNIVRWETSATKLFLRSREFLWQEGHCVYETREECDTEVKKIILAYQSLVKTLLALPTLVGTKTEKEKFAGANYTTTIEAFMPDGKALQCGTSHNLGEGFSKAFGITYVGRDEIEHLPWQSSWGLSTRLIGGAVMTHSDDKGLVLSPRVCRNSAVIIPLLFKGKEEGVITEAKKIEKALRPFKPILDARSEYKPGYKFSEWEMKGIPVRIEIGPKDLEKKQVIVVKRNDNEKIPIKIKDLKAELPKILARIHDELYDKAYAYLQENIVTVNTLKEFKEAIKARKIVHTPWCGETACEEDIKDRIDGATSRCETFDSPEIKGKVCSVCGKKAVKWMYFSKSY